MYEYKCTILRVVDGDTVDIDIDLGFNIWVRGERVRVHGIDTPESRTSDKVEKVFGEASKKRVKELLPIGSVQILKTIKDSDGGDAKGKFGRILGDFIIEDKLLSEIMVEEGHAVKYFGQNKADVEMEHLANRQRLLYEEKVKLD